jgi:hypothetical protein
MSPSRIRQIPAKMAVTISPTTAFRPGVFRSGPVIPIVMVGL